MTDLKNCTFIIPLMIEHEDRYNNAKSVLSYINKNFETNVFIYEIVNKDSKLDFLDSLSNLKIRHWTAEQESAFHRTKYLNIMLDKVTTKVVVNYDIDVLLKPDTYAKAVSLIYNGKSDVIYPYRFGNNGQRRIQRSSNIHSDFVSNGYDLDFIDSNPNLYSDFGSEYGHCIFFNTDTYKKYGAENENFISYGPEDKERGERFIKIGFNVNWMNESIVYHFEHHRGPDSSNNNPEFLENWRIYNICKSMSREKTIFYYKEQKYNEKYKTIGK
jgi:predicted glycosyltransferase involved in capsule biosynthesis